MNTKTREYDDSTSMLALQLKKLTTRLSELFIREAEILSGCEQNDQEMMAVQE